MNFISLALVFCAASSLAATKPRARDLGIPFDGTPGKLNAITDVKGVEVGFVTLNRGEGKLQVGKGPVRTGVTAVLPRGRNGKDAVFAGWFSQNGNGEMTGTTWIEESGMLEGPVMITNTHSVGTVRDAVVAWRVKQGKTDSTISLPVVAETWDGWLNDINGFHVKEADALKALDDARGGPVPEGNVGSGMGMICYEFKCGIGTSSRITKAAGREYTVGVLVQANHGLRHQLRLAGVPVGAHFKNDLMFSKETGSIIIVVATDAPLLPHQLKRLARRATMGLARTGSVSGDGSGDIFVAFSTAHSAELRPKKIAKVEMVPNGELDGLFAATVEATEEAIVNSLAAAEKVTGVDGHLAPAIPMDKVLPLLTKPRLVPAKP